MNLLRPFVSRTFIIFCIIGFITTFVHFIIFNLILDFSGLLLANTVAFVIASLYSYWANATFAFKKRINQLSFWLAMLTFIIKLWTSNGLALILKFILINLGYQNLIFLIPIPVTCITFPLQYLIFDKIFLSKKPTTL